MTFKFSTASEQRLVGVHPHLVNVVRLALARSPLDFSITEGLRTKERQAQLVASGASRTMNSRHLTGHAVDLAAYVDGHLSWDWPLYRRLADEAMLPAAKELGIAIVWGGSWVSFKDGPHFELDRKVYPA